MGCPLYETEVPCQYQYRTKRRTNKEWRAGVERTSPFQSHYLINAVPFIVPRSRAGCSESVTVDTEVNVWFANFQGVVSVSDVATKECGLEITRHRRLHM